MYPPTSPTPPSSPTESHPVPAPTVDVTVDTVEPRLRLLFSQKVTCLWLTPEQARSLAAMLLRAAKTYDQRHNPP